MSEKVLIIGLDGGTWSIFNGLFQDGAMPFFENIVKKSSSGILESTIPPITPVAWSSFQTGVGPEKHGIFGFINFSQKSRKFTLINASMLQMPTIWEHLSSQGKLVVSINVPVTFPPKPINGYMVTGMFTPGTNSDYTYPQELKNKIIDKFGEFPILTGLDIHNKNKKIDEFITVCTETIEKQTKIARYLMSEKQWDFFMMHYQMTDTLQHPLWCFLDKAHPQYNSKIYHQYIKHFYRHLDECIKELVDLAENQGNKFVVFMSDHGFQRNKYTFHINNWLSQSGFLKTKGATLHFLMKTLRGIYKKTRLGASMDMLMKNIKNIEQLFSIDWERSIGYAIANNSFAQIFLKNGIKESDRLRLIDALMSIKAPDNNIFFESCHTKEELYGQIVNNYMPDLVLIPKNGNSCLSTFDDKNIFTTPKYPDDYQVGCHHPDGIFVISGENISLRDNLKANITDILPTVLYMLDVEIPSFIDGKVITDVFSQKYLSKKNILFSDSKFEKKKDDFQYTDSDKAKIEKSLKDLGYL